MKKKYVNVFGLMLLTLLFGGLLLAPFTSAKDTKYDKLKDVQVIGDASKKLDKTLAKDFIEVEASFGATTNATVTIKEGKLTLLITDDVNSAGRWFRINSKVLEKFNLNIDLVNVYVDGKETEKAFEEDKDGKWLLFYVDHFTTRYVTFEASEGYVELADWSYENYVKLLEENPSGQFNLSGTLYDYALWQGNEADLPAYLNATLFCPLDSLDTTNNVTKCYLNKEEVNATVSTIENVSLVSGVVKNAFRFIGGPEKIKLQDRINITSAIDMFFYINSADTKQCDIVQYWTWNGNKGFYIGKDASGRLKLTVGHGDGTSSNYIFLTTEYQTNKFYAVRAYISTNQMLIQVYDADTKQLVKEFNEVPTKPIVFPNATDALSAGGFVLGRGGFSVVAINGTIDEFRAKIDSQFTDEEVQMLLNINRHKTAQLSAPSATFDGSQFLVNVTAQLPGDGGSYVLPAPLGAQGLTSIGTIGNFTFLDAGTAGEVSYTLPVSEDLSCPVGINLLAWLYDNEIYMTGAEDQFPVVATVMNLPKGVWELVNGRVVLNQIMTNYTRLIIANATGPTVVTRVSNFYADPQNNYVNLTVLSSSNKRIYFNASALSGEKVTFTWEGKRDVYPYEVYVDGKFYMQKLADKNGVLTFTYSNWSSHTFEIKEKDPIEYGWDFGVAMVLGMIGILIIDAFVETSNLERKDDLRKVLAAMLVAMFAVFVFSLI